MTATKLLRTVGPLRYSAFKYLVYLLSGKREQRSLQATSSRFSKQAFLQREKACFAL